MPARSTRRVGARARVELVDPLAGLAQLLALLGDEFLQLVDLARESLEEVVDLVDVVAANPDFEGHRVDGVQRRVGGIRAIHATTLPLCCHESLNWRLRCWP